MSRLCRVIKEKIFFLDIFIFAIVLVGYSLIAGSLLSYPVEQVAEDWVVLQQALFQGTILFSYLTLISKISDYRSLWISFLGGYFLQKVMFFDDIVHPYFISSGFYALIGAEKFGLNPQYSKIVLMVPGLVLNLGFFLFFKPKRVLRSLRIVFIGVVGSAIYLNHSSFPSGIMSSTLKEREKFLNGVEIYSKTGLREFCIHINARCRVVSQTGPELLTDPYFDLKDEGSKILADMSKYLEKKIEISILETNNLRGIYIVKKLVDGTYIEIFEHDYVNMTWNLNLGYFSKSTYFVTFFWLVFLFALIPIHSLRRESK